MIKRALPILPVLVLIACVPDVSDPNIQAAVINSLTATSWTPTPVTPSATSQPNTTEIVEILNSAMIGLDPLAETVLAKHSVIDAQVVMDHTMQQATILRIHVDCEWIFSDTCTPESTFVVLMNTFSSNVKVIKRIIEQIPTTITTMEMIAFDQMSQTNMITIGWGDVVAFSFGDINGQQLGSRIFRTSATP
jgi:hypothetical protein